MKKQRKIFPDPLAVLSCVLGLSLLSGCGGAPEGSGPGALPAELVTLNNRGVGEMGYFDYASARETFAAVVARAPDWLDARVNLAIATLNRQQPGDEARAAALLQAVLAEDPDHLRARYMLGILSFNGGEVAAARGHFDAVAQAAPDDAYAAYFLGQCALQLGEPEAALAALEQATVLDPYLRSAFYGAFVAAQQLGRRDAARAFLERYRELETNPRSRLAEIKYTRMGPRSFALAVRRSEQPAPAPPPESYPGPLAPAPLAAGPFQVPPLAGAALDDGRDRWLALPDRRRGLTLLAPGGEAAAVPGMDDPAVRAVAFGDFDNDGLTDLYLGRDGDNRLLRRTAGGWEDVTAGTGSALPGSRTDDVLFLDADHDGDLDLFVVNAGGPDELLNNDGDGSFRPLALERGLAGSGEGGRVTAVDLDGDRDDDLLRSRPGAPPVVFRNDRLWNYAAEPGPERLTGTAVLALDLEADGRVELCGFDGQRLACLAREDGAWGTVLERTAGLDDPRELAAADFDADGAWEFLVAGASSWAVVEAREDGATLGGGSGRVLAVHYPEPGLGPALVLQDPAGALAELPPAPGAYLGLTFAGRESPGDSMRSNASGIGTRFVLRNGSRWTAGKRLPMDTGPGASLTPVAIGLAGGAAADYVEIDWTDGVFQTELSPSAGQTLRVVETQRQLASCPVLFAWNGQRHQFLSDVLGVAGIGFAVGPGVYSEPRPWERFRIDAQDLAPRDGAFELRLTEPMEELAYLDRVTLTAYDHPESHRLVLDERMGTGGAQPTGEALLYRERVLPVAARTTAAADVLAALRERDGEAVPPGSADPRFLGLLQEPLVLTLEFDRDLHALGEALLLLDGWVEYGYSQTSFAAWQAGLAYEPPSLEARAGDGRWHLVAPRFGYPAGMPREAVLPLPPLPAGTRALRLRSNQEIYFDHLAVAPRDAGAALEIRELPLGEARVERIGFPRRSDGPQRRPHYDYADRQPFWDTRYPRGLYTRLGPATELVADADNALAIIGPGDALLLRFPAVLAPPRPGWRRSFVVGFEGWAKDMDLYTRDGETVAPLPRRPLPVDRSALNARYNTRFQSGR